MNTTHAEQASLLLVDDDATFCDVLRRALEKRNFSVTVAHSVEEAQPMAQANPPEYAVVDLKMSGASGLALVKMLHELDPATRIVVLTGYASIATAVEAIKLGKNLTGAEFCAPLTALHGHVKHLMHQADYIFLPFYFVVY